MNATEARRAAFIEMLRDQSTEQPRMAEPSYTEEQARKLLEQVQCYASARGITQARLAGLLGIAGSSMSSLMGGKYAGDLDGHLLKIAQFLDREAERAEKPSITRFVETSVAKGIFTILRQNHVHGTMGAVIADSGVGKTRAFQEYAIRNENVIYVSASEWTRTHSEVARKLARVLMVDRQARVFQDRCEAIQDKLQGASRLLIMDQAHQLNERACQFLQNLWDQCNPSDDDRRLGIVFGCTWRFWSEIHAAKVHYLYEQLTSRMNAGTNRKIGKAPFRMADIDLLFSTENLKFELTDSARQHLLDVANGEGGLRTAVANVDHLQHLLIKSKSTGAMITVENLKQTQDLMLKQPVNQAA